MGLKVDHIAILVSNLNSASEKYKKLLQVQPIIEEVKEEEVTVALFELDNISIELVCPFISNKKLLNRLKEKGEGIHHFALRSKNEDFLKIIELNKKGSILEGYPRKGASGKIVSFLNPKYFNSTLIEFVENLKKED